MRSSPRIAISGIGVVSPYGAGRECYWTQVRQGRSATRRIDEFDASPYTCQVAAPLPAMSIDQAPKLDAHPSVSGHDSESLLRERADARRYSRASLAGVIAAREAWRDAGLRLGEPDAGVIIGTGGGGIELGERQYREFFTDGLKRVTPYAIPVSICGMLSSEISMALQLHGISHVLSTGCTSSTDATGYAMSLLRAGETEALLCGGVDACVTPGMIYGFSRMRVVSTAFNDTPELASRPFDQARDGFVLGEGAWMYVLEREDRARARGAHVYAVLEGYGSTCDAYHRVQMDPEGQQIVRAMQLALARASRAPESIGYVNFHGTSTQLNDAIEIRCVRAVFDGHVSRLHGSSTKSMVGHPQGASGACGIVTTALALDRGYLPPTINVARLDPACDMDVLPNAGRASQVEAALCNCLGFGSKNSAVVMASAHA
jgi:3-oxoacyl-[acyl-carrier-protein] synthase II